MFLSTAQTELEPENENGQPYIDSLNNFIPAVMMVIRKVNNLIERSHWSTRAAKYEVYDDRCQVGHYNDMLS